MLKYCIKYIFLGLPDRKRREIQMGPMSQNSRPNTNVDGNISYGNQNRIERMDMGRNPTRVIGHNNTRVNSSDTLYLPTPPPPDNNIRRRYMHLDNDDRLPNLQFTIPPDGPEFMYVPTLTPPHSASSTCDDPVNNSQTLIPPSPPRRNPIVHRGSNVPTSMSQNVVPRSLNHGFATHARQQGNAPKPVVSSVVRTQTQQIRSVPRTAVLRQRTSSNNEHVPTLVEALPKVRSRSAPSCTIVREPNVQQCESATSSTFIDQHRATFETQQTKMTTSQIVDKYSCGKRSGHGANAHSNRSSYSTSTLGTSESANAHNARNSGVPSSSRSDRLSQPSSHSTYTPQRVYESIPPVASSSRDFQTSHVLRQNVHLQEHAYEDNEQYEVVNESMEHEGLPTTKYEQEKHYESHHEPQRRPLDDGERETINRVINDVENQIKNIQNTWEEKNKEKEEIKQKLAQNEREIREDLLLQNEIRKKHEEESKNLQS